jgi:adenylyltransferase/sulfurtransferase
MAMSERRSRKPRYRGAADRVGDAHPDGAGRPRPAIPPEPPALAGDEFDRYSRHVILREIGTAGQGRIKAARVLLVGAGGLGSPVGLYLAAAGVGRLGIVDRDAVELPNLQRQVAFGTRDVGKSKLEAAGRRLRDLNAAIEIILHEVRLERSNAFDILSDYDIVVDGSDNFATRYLVNDACVLSGKPDVFGSVIRFQGQVSVFGFDGGPCYRCLFPEPPSAGVVPGCSEAGVLGPLPGIIGSIMASETIKIIVGRGDVLSGRVLNYDALLARFQELIVRKDPDCPVCGSHRTITELPDYDGFCGRPGSSPDSAPERFEVSAPQLKDALDGGNDILLLDVREPYEFRICNLGGLLIPLAELPGRLSEIDRSRDIVVYCHSGIRSAAAAEFLRRAGYPRVRNLRGGILAWADEVDPTIPSY